MARKCKPHIHSRVGGSGGNNTQSEMVSLSMVNERARKERSCMDLPPTERPYLTQRLSNGYKR